MTAENFSFSGNKLNRGTLYHSINCFEQQTVSHCYIVGIVVINVAHLRLLVTYSIYTSILQVWSFSDHIDQFLFLDYESLS